MTTARLEAYEERRAKLREYAAIKNLSKTELDLCEDMLDMLEEGYSWDDIINSFSSPRVAHWTKEQLYNAGIPTGLPE